MEYYIYTLTSLAGLLVLIKVIFSEVEGRMAIKSTNIRWLLQYTKSFSYRRSANLLMVAVFCYIVSSVQPMLSLIWVLELIGFFAVAVVADAIGQFFSYHYIKRRFSKAVKEGELLYTEVQSALEKEDTELIYHSEATYDTYSIMDQYIQEEDHLAIVSVDGGKFVSKYKKLPPITYVVEAFVEKAKEQLEDLSLKVTHYTKDGRIPFKDEKLDVIVNEMANYDKFEFYRALKPGGHVIIEQMGSDYHKEIRAMFSPLRIKGRWDKMYCTQTLEDIGLEVLDEYEDIGYIRFKSLSAFITYMREFSPEKVEKLDIYINFYAHILQAIKQHDFFDLTTHRFVVAARKKEID